MLLLPLGGGPVGGAGGVCLPVLLAFLVTPNGGGAVGVTLCRGRGGDGRGVVGDVPWHVVGGVGGGVNSAVGVGVAGVADGEGVTGDTWSLACLVVV